LQILPVTPLIYIVAKRQTHLNCEPNYIDIYYDKKMLTNIALR